MHRRGFICTVAGAAASMATSRFSRGAGADALAGRVMTVRGPRPPSELGCVLPHEHVLVDFIGAAEISPGRYDPSAASAKIQPFLDRARALGVGTLCECTPAFLGRNPALLLQLSAATGLHLVTNTGYYSVRQNKFVPAHALTEDADAIAGRWLREWRDGIDGTAVRPGFIKIGVDAGPLTPVGRKIVQAAARTHRASGLTIVSHTGDDAAARAQLEVLRGEVVHPSSWVWAHAQKTTDAALLIATAQSGAWVSLDGIAPRSLARHVELAVVLRRAGCLGQMLVSHDAGWYRPGEPDGGAFRDYELLFRGFIPALREEKFSEAEIRQLIVTNPARALAVRVRAA